MNKQCTGCVVSAGTHKPAEALHQQIAEPQTQQPEALDRAGLTAIRLAREGDQHAAETIRAQQARIAELEAICDEQQAGTERLRAQLAAAPQAVQPSRVVPTAVKVAPIAHPAKVEINWECIGQVRPNIHVSGWNIDGANLVRGANIGALIGLANMLLDEAEHQGHSFAATQPAAQGMDALRKEIENITRLLPANVDCSGVWAALAAAQAKQGGGAS